MLEELVGPRDKIFPIRAVAVSTVMLPPGEVAVEQATVSLMDWLVAEYGFSLVDERVLMKAAVDEARRAKIAALMLMAYAAASSLPVPSRCNLMHLSVIVWHCHAA